MAGMSLPFLVSAMHHAGESLVSPHICFITKTAYEGRMSLRLHWLFDVSTHSFEFDQENNSSFAQQSLTRNVGQCPT